MTDPTVHTIHRFEESIRCSQSTIHIESAEKHWSFCEKIHIIQSMYDNALTFLVCISFEQYYERAWQEKNRDSMWIAQTPRAPGLCRCHQSPLLQTLTYARQG